MRRLLVTYDAWAFAPRLFVFVSLSFASGDATVPMPLLAYHFAIHVG